MGEQPEDDVLRGGPALQTAFEVYPDNSGMEDLPWHADHHIHSVSTANAGCEDAEAPGVGGMGIGSKHHEAWKGVALQYDLVNDPGSGHPAAESVALGSGGQEVVDFTVFKAGRCQVRLSPLTSPYQMIAVNGNRHSGLVFAGKHELEDGHLGGRVLQRHPVGQGLDVGNSGGEIFSGGIGEMTIEDLFGIGQRPSESLPDEGD